MVVLACEGLLPHLPVMSSAIHRKTCWRTTDPAKSPRIATIGKAISMLTAYCR
jgi:hypothetical protein